MAKAEDDHDETCDWSCPECGFQWHGMWDENRPCPMCRQRELAAEIERLREFCLRAHRGLAGKKYDPDLFDALAREAKKAADVKGE